MTHLHVLFAGKQRDGVYLIQAVLAMRHRIVRLDEYRSHETNAIAPSEMPPSLVADIHYQAKLRDCGKDQKISVMPLFIISSESFSML